MIDRVRLGTASFFLLFILFFPLDFFGDVQRSVTDFLFGSAAQFIAENLMGYSVSTADFSSDSVSMFALVILLALLSMIITKPQRSVWLIGFVKEIVIIYLALVLLKYGFDKLFNGQFYQPEPNILYTRFGNLDRDILFWSTLGVSKTYSMLTGAIEILAAALLLFSRMRIIGLLLSAVIFVQIILINLGFDISVKFFSVILLLMTVFALESNLKPLYKFFVLGQVSHLSISKVVQSRNMQSLLFFLKFLAVSFLLVKVLYVPFQTGIFDDDLAERPTLHGAFKNVDERFPISYIFFHRNQYLILMDRNERMTNYQYEIKTDGSLLLRNIQGNQFTGKVQLNRRDSLLTISVENKVIFAKEENWRNMPALQTKLHFFVEDVK